MVLVVLVQVHVGKCSQASRSRTQMHHSVLFKFTVTKTDENTIEKKMQMYH